MRFRLTDHLQRSRAPGYGGAPSFPCQAVRCGYRYFGNTFMDRLKVPCACPKRRILSRLRGLDVPPLTTTVLFLPRQSARRENAVQLNGRTKSGHLRGMRVIMLVSCALALLGTRASLLHTSLCTMPSGSQVPILHSLPILHDPCVNTS